MDLTGLLDPAPGAVKISLEAMKHKIWWRFLVERRGVGVVYNSLSDFFSQQPNDQN